MFFYLKKVLLKKQQVLINLLANKIIIMYKTICFINYLEIINLKCNFSRVNLLTLIFY